MSTIKNDKSNAKAVLYLRRSTDRQEQSIKDQRSELESYAAKHDYKIAGEYLDDAISGDKTEDRHEFLRMRDEASAGSFDLVLCWDQDRFGRFDILDAGHWVRPFREAGVRLETICQGRIDWEDLVGQLIYSVNQLGKAQFLRDLSRNTVRGMIASAKSGKAGTGGRSPYGYRHSGDQVWIVEDEAKVVRLIFDEFLKPDGSLRFVAALLNRQGIKSPSGGVWRMSSVRVVIKRRKYTGTFVFLEKSSGSYYSAEAGGIVPRRKADKWTSTEAITHQKKFAAIIPQKMFDRVQAKLAKSKSNTAPKQARQYLFSGMVRCGDCGGAMGGRMQTNGPIYKCRLYHQTGRSECYCNTIKEAPLVSVIVKKIQDRYLCPSALDRLRCALRTEQERSKPKPMDIKRIKADIEKMDRKIDNAEDAILDAPQHLRPGLYRKLESLTADRDRLKSDLDAATSYQSGKHKADEAEIDEAINALKTLGEAFNKAKPEDTRELISSIVSKIELHYDHEEMDGGRMRNTFSHGTIYVRPASGNSAQLITKGPVLRRGGTAMDSLAASCKRAPVPLDSLLTQNFLGYFYTTLGGTLYGDT